MDNPRGFRAKRHRLHLPKLMPFLPAHLRPNAIQRTDKIVNHPVGIGVIDIKAVKFTIRRHINTVLPLNINDNACRIDECLLSRHRRKPLWNRIRTDGCG